MKFNYVRIFTLFILLLSVGVFTSCSSLNGGDNNGQDSAFVGKWKLVKVTLTGETPDVSEFQGFSLDLNSGGTYVLANPTGFPSPTGVAGTYQSDGRFLVFNPGTSVEASISGNSMVWEWQVSKPNKITATYRYTFERM